MMKYATNHPEEFDHPGLAFLVGFMQFSGGLLCEFACLLYLSTIESTMDVIIKFIALGKIAMIDDMYAAAMPKENKLKRNALKLKSKKDGGTGEKAAFEWTKYRRGYKLEDGRTCWVKTLSFFTKVIRIIYCSFIFYFFPIVTLCPFLLGTPLSKLEFAPDNTANRC
jgi:hypothetical protein